MIWPSRIKLYTVATFLFKAVNYAMRDRLKAASFQHLRLYGQLLNHYLTNSFGLSVRALWGVASLWMVTDFLLFWANAH